MIEITDADIREDIKHLEARIAKAQKQLNETTPVMTAKDKAKVKQLRGEIDHVLNLIRIAEGALVATNWDDAR